MVRKGFGVKVTLRVRWACFRIIFKGCYLVPTFLVLLHPYIYKVSLFPFTL